MAGQIGHYARGEVEYLVVHDGTVLLELDDFSWNFTIPKSPGGAGLGRLKNRYHKRTNAPTGTWNISRKWLTHADKGDLFMELATGAGIIITEAIANGSVTHTPAQTLVSILSIKLITSGTLLTENDDYTVNYATGVVTFNAAIGEAAEIRYLSTAGDWMGENLLLNSSLEDDITNIWALIATGTVAHSAAAKYADTYGLLIGINAQNDGASYTPDIAVFPNRVYRLTAMLQGVTAADDIDARWEDAAGHTGMTAVLTADVLANAVWKLHEWTFTPDEATILSISIRNVDAAAASNIYLDEIYLRENAPRVNMMRAGLRFGFVFDVHIRRTVDNVVVEKLVGCEIYDEGISSGDAYTESISGQYLDREVLKV